MAYQTEQEQIEIFTTWWKHNGTSLVVGVILVFGGYFGWTAWQNHQHAQEEKASAIFQQILDAKSGGDKAVDVVALSEQLKKDYADTFYTQAASLLLAEEAVKKADLESAEKELTLLVAQKPKGVMLYTANLRLGRVLYAEGKYDAALIQLQEPLPKAYESLFAELRGDILVAKGQASLARASYNAALAALPKEGDEQKKIIEMKLSDLPDEAVAK